jgi:6-hydroxycyclohex-1-ene-1-carbonyl-CoA dehydrogenase
VKAALFYGPHRPLELEERPIPRAGPGELVIKVAACGLCHTDLHYIDHGVPTFAKPPLVLGHEASGIVSEVGAGVEGWHAGDRVLIPAVLSCGRCEACRRGRENICERGVMLGNHVDGAYAEYLRVPAKDVLTLPMDLPLEEACLIADAVSTPYHAVVNRGEVRPGERVAVFGCGGVGINVVQIASAIGADVWAVDLKPERLAFAQEFGAAHVVDAGSTPEPGKAIRREPGGVDVAFEAIGSPATIRQALESLRRGGRLIIVGFSMEPVELPAGKIMFQELEIRGSLGCRPVDYPRIIELARTGKIKVAQLVTNRVSLAQINSGFDTLREGRGLRTIVVPSA